MPSESQAPNRAAETIPDDGACGPLLLQSPVRFRWGGSTKTPRTGVYFGAVERNRRPISAARAYYLGLEQGFRDRYNNFVRRLHEGNATLEDVFIVAPASGFARIMRAAGSTSVFPFYTLLAALLVMVRAVVLG